VVFRGTAVFLAYAYGNRIEGVATSDSDLAISYHYGEHDQVDCAGFFTAPVRRPHGSPRRSFALKAISGNIRKPEAQFCPEGDLGKYPEARGASREGSQCGSEIRVFCRHVERRKVFEGRDVDS
jgi:hypothetical protein